MLCFVAASTFWLLNALNKSYSTQTTYPVAFIYNDQKLVATQALPEEVTINVTGKGWKLLRKSLRLEVKPAEIFIRNLPRNNYLLGSALRPALVNAMDGLQLNFVITDTLHFRFEEKLTRRIPLKLDPKQKIADSNFAVVGQVNITPKFITFTGPSSKIDSIPSPYLLRLPETGLKAPAEIEVPIALKNALLTSDIEEAIVKVNVKELVQEEKQLVAELINAPQGKKIVLLPPHVLVRYQFLNDSVTTLNREGFKVILDFSKYSQQDSTLVPELVQKPAGARNIKLSPVRVRVLTESN
nr:hypothetical protein [Pontibacter vulgaris]